MKKLLILILLFNASIIFSQEDKDLSEIINLLVKEYNSDTLDIYFRFENNRLKSGLENTKTQQDWKIHKFYNNDNDFNVYLKEVAPRIYDDSVTVSMDKIKFNYLIQRQKIKKTNNKRICRFAKADFNKRKKKERIVYISIPLLSTDTNKAIVYASHRGDGFCSNGGILLFKKINGIWKLIKYEQRWIS